MIAGGGQTSYYLAKFLLDMKMKVKIIEIDPDRCRELSEDLEDALIINGDASNQNVLYEEGIEETDAFISLTSIDEENIVYSMFASLKKVPRIITKVNRGCEAIYTFENENYEIQEFSVRDDFKKFNVKIKDLNIKDGVLLIAIQRGRNIIIPTGESEIKENDTIVLIDNSDSIMNINDILE